MPNITHQPIFDDSFVEIHEAYPHATVFWVGGCVRDYFMGVESKDIDYVVVGLDPSDLTNLGWTGFGESFFVFIHPRTGCEIALARSERKIGKGYTEFEITSNSSITIEEDLIRRDLSINAIAINCTTYEIVDPHNGVNDINVKILRPVSKAFMEDPVRSLRVARFMARYGSNWSYHKDVIDYTNIMIGAGEFDTIHQSRIILELEKAFDSMFPQLFFKTCEELNISHLYGDFTHSTNPLLNNWKSHVQFMANVVAIGYPTIELVKKWNIDTQLCVSLIEAGTFSNKDVAWHDTPESLLETITKLHLFRNVALCNFLTGCSLVHTPTQQYRIGTIRSVLSHATDFITFTSLNENGQLNDVIPKDRSGVVNQHRLEYVKSMLPTIYKCLTL